MEPDDDDFDDEFPGASIAGRNRTDAEWERLFKSMRTPESGQYGRLIRLCEAKDSEFLGLSVESLRRRGKLPKDPADPAPADYATETVKALKNARRWMLLCGASREEAMEKFAVGDNPKLFEEIITPEVEQELLAEQARLAIEYGFTEEEARKRYEIWPETKLLPSQNQPEQPVANEQECVAEGVVPTGHSDEAECEDLLSGITPEGEQRLQAATARRVMKEHGFSEEARRTTAWRIGPPARQICPPAPVRPSGVPVSERRLGRDSGGVCAGKAGRAAVSGGTGSLLSRTARFLQGPACLALR
jgi:hypothetical protein